MGNLAHGDLGTSQEHPVVKISELIFPKLVVSTQLLLIPTILIFVLGLPIGIYTATRQGRWQDPLTIGSLLFVAAIPEVLLIPVLQVIFAIKLKWLPVGGWDGFFSARIILPVIVLTLPALGGLARLMRGQHPSGDGGRLHPDGASKRTERADCPDSPRSPERHAPNRHERHLFVPVFVHR